MAEEAGGRLCLRGINAMLRTLSDANLAELLANWVTAVGVLAAAAGGLWAYWRYRADQRQHRWDQARSLYGSFIDIAIANPEFRPNFWSDVAEHDEEARNKYRWLMARFLWAAEDIVLNLDKADDDGRRAWVAAIEVTAREHADFFASPDGQIEKTCYYKPLVRIIDEALDRLQSPSVDV